MGLELDCPLSAATSKEDSKGRKKTHFKFLSALEWLSAIYQFYFILSLYTFCQAEAVGRLLFGFYNCFQKSGACCHVWLLPPV